MLSIIFKALKNSMPQYIQSLFHVRENKKNLRGRNKLVLPVAKTATYGLKRLLTLPLRRGMHCVMRGMHCVSGMR